MSSCRTRLRGMPTSAFDSSSRHETVVARGTDARRRGSIDQRPDDVADPRLDTPEAARAGAAQQTEEVRLGLIVPRVADREAVRVPDAPAARPKNS